MRIRRATAGDATAIAHVHRSSRAEAYGSEFAVREKGGDPELFVADHDGAVVGFAAVEGPLLGALYVLPGAQGGGAGAALLRSAMKEGASELWVYSANDGARRFYERHGWVAEPESEMTGENWRPRSPAVRYRLDATAQDGYRKAVPK